MAKINKTAIQDCDLLNRVFASYFLNECVVKENINFDDYRPEAPHISILNSEGYFFNEPDHISHLKHFHHSIIVFPDIDLKKFHEVGIVEYFNDEMKKQFSDACTDFANQLKTNQYCDLVFSSLPDAHPHNYSCLYDPDTNFRSRLIVGTDFASGTQYAIWEFHALMMHKLRGVEPHVIYGKTYKSVDEMTDDEKQIYFFNNKEKY